MDQKYSLTQEGQDRLQIELADLKKNKRPQAVLRLKTAREMGDLSENSEYVAAKEDLSFIDGRIFEIEETLKNATVVSHSSDKSAVELGNKVVIQTDGKKEAFMIVDKHEADITQNRLSSSSPIGKAILGRHIDETIEVVIPTGKVLYKIVEIK